MLQKWGHTVVVASDGKLTLKALEKESFDLVLMDVQMPELSGLEATAAIRQREQTTGAHLPIIAMTAHAMKGDRERCLAAGMDAYIAKPVNPEEMFNALEAVAAGLHESQEQVGRPSDDAGAAKVVANAPTPRAPIRKSDVLNRLGGDEEFLREIVGLFLDNCPKMLGEVRQAIDLADDKMLERTAHTLKGAVGNFEARDAFEAALKLETMGREGDLEGARLAFADLEAQLQRLRPALEAMAKEGCAMRVLIAEDEPVSRRMLERVLGQWGYQVVVAEDGSAAWDVLAAPGRRAWSSWTG